MADNSFDVIVIGSGPGGYVAAIRGAQLGLKVACVEADKLGGVCNNIGCIPTKAMLESAKYAKKASSLKDFGVNVGDVTLDIAIAAKRAQSVASQGNKGVAFLFKKNKVTTIEGWGRLAGNGKVEVEKDGKKATYSAKHIVLATGSRPRSLPMLEIDGDRVWSSDQAVFAPEAPKSIAIIGAGAIGMEFADVFSAFGSQVTIIEALDQVLPLEDKDSAQVVERSYKKRGMTIYTSARVEKADVGKKSVKLTFKDKAGKDQTIEVDRVLVAVGRAPIIDDIGLEKAGVKTDRGFIQVNDRLETTAKGVYAIGDCARPPLLAHKASHEGIVLMEHIAGKGHGWVDYNNIPNVTYCHPEVASVGLTEQRAKEQGLDYEVGSFPWSANGRARTAGETEGFVKIIRDKKYGEILGAHIVGPSASELIGEFVLGRHLESTVEELERAMHPHPTLSEAIAEAALASMGRVIHM
ncbi:MAG: dihydrolipoyl dehydrogenase [Candidatus Cloacimonetes bacterium]|nr:dihydrolipoyl dehydrogenase [Candidatus Cloacimonadota bacterium]